MEVVEHRFVLRCAEHVVSRDVVIADAEQAEHQGGEQAGPVLASVAMEERRGWLGRDRLGCLNQLARDHLEQPREHDLVLVRGRAAGHCRARRRHDVDGDAPARTLAERSRRVVLAAKIDHETNAEVVTGSGDVGRRHPLRRHTAVETVRPDAPSARRGVAAQVPEVQDAFEVVLGHRHSPRSARGGRTRTPPCRGRG